MTGPADIDALFATEKRVAGQVDWAEDRAGAASTMKAPLAIDGTIVGGLFLAANATRIHAPQRGQIVLIYADRPICRLGFRPQASHANPLSPETPRPHRGATLPPEASRVYPWPLNRRWPREPGDNLPVASLIGAALNDFETALAWFMNETRIVGEIPSPPWEPVLI